MNAKLYMVAGRSGVGKTTIISNLIKAFPDIYQRPQSITTRQRRPQENNSEYEFLNLTQYQQYLNNGELLNDDCVYGNFYGMLEYSVSSILNKNMIAIKEIHPNNHDKIRKKLPDSISILIKPFEDHILKVEERPDRGEDFDYYKNIDISKFDIVFTIDNDSVDLHYDLHNLIQAHQRDLISGFKPADIDYVNMAGYSLVLPEFTDELRITTSNFHEATRQFWMNFVSSIPVDSKCLEVGVGQGWLDQITNISEKCLYQGVDLVLSDVSPPNTHQSSANKLPFPNASFDYIIASLADPFICHLSIAQIYRILKYNGVFCFTYPANEWSSSLRESSNKHYTEFKLNSGEKVKVYSFCYSLNDILSMLNNEGFSLVESKSLGLDAIPSKYKISNAFNQILGSQSAGKPIINIVIVRKDL